MVEVKKAKDTAFLEKVTIMDTVKNGTKYHKILWFLFICSSSTVVVVIA